MCPSMFLGTLGIPILSVVLSMTKWIAVFGPVCVCSREHYTVYANLCIVDRENKFY